MSWDDLSMREKAAMMRVAVKNKIFDIDNIKKQYNSYAEGGNYTVGNLVDAIYLNNPKEEFLEAPNRDYTQSEEWANAHGYYPDAKGHRDDRVKKPAHPSHPSRGTWQGDNFILTDKGFEDPNYTLFGLNDGGQDPLATLIYDDAIVLPEITVTPNGNYINNSYDNIRLHLKSNGGSINKFDKGGKKSNFIDFITGHKEEKKQAAEEAAEWAKEYYLSEGFKERMKKLPHYYNQYRELYYPNWNHSVSFDYTLPEDPEFKYSNTKPSSYDTENDIITVGTRRNPEDYYKIINHELGHKYSKGVKTNIDTGEGTVTFEGGHYNYYPVFREGKQYLEALNNLTQADKRLFETYPESMAEEVHHDALPGENYADLISLRSELDKANIYDSNKSNNVFTKEHLDKAREYGITSRLFDNFDDDAIILMMNDVAHTTINDSGNNYAANGGKINRFDYGGSKKSKNSDWPESYPESLLPYLDVLDYLRNLNIQINDKLYPLPYQVAATLLTRRGAHLYAPDNIAHELSKYYEGIIDEEYGIRNNLDNYSLNRKTRDYQLMMNAIYNKNILTSPSLIDKVSTRYVNTRRPNGLLEDMEYWKSLENPYKKVVPFPKKTTNSSLDNSLDSIGGFFTAMGTMLNSINEGGLKLSKASNNSLESVQKAYNKVRLVLNAMESSVEQSKNLPRVIYDAAQVAGQENLERRDEQYKSRDMFMNSLQTGLGLHGLIGNTANMFPNLAYRTVPAGIGTTLSPTLLGSIAYFKPWNASRSMLAGIALDATQAFLNPTEGGRLYNVGETTSGLAGLIGFSDVLLKVPKIGKALDFTFDAIGVLLNAKDATNFVTNFDLYAVDRLNKMIEDSNSEEPAK